MADQTGTAPTPQKSGTVDPGVNPAHTQALRLLVYSQLYYPEKYAGFVKALELDNVPFSYANPKFLEKLLEFSASFRLFLSETKDHARLDATVPGETIKRLTEDLISVPQTVASVRRKFVEDLVRAYLDRLKKTASLSGEEQIREQAVAQVLAALEKSPDPKGITWSVANVLTQSATAAAREDDKKIIEEMSRRIALAVSTEAKKNLKGMARPAPPEEDVTQAAIDNPLTRKNLWLEVYIRSAGLGLNFPKDRVTKLARLAEAMHADTSGVELPKGARGKIVESSVRRVWAAQTSIDRLIQTFGELGASSPVLTRFIAKGNAVFGIKPEGKGALAGLRNLASDVASAFREPVNDVLVLSYLGIITEQHVGTIRHVYAAREYSRNPKRFDLELATRLGTDAAKGWVLKKAAGTTAGKAISAGLGKMLGGLLGSLGGVFGSVLGLVLGDKIVNAIGRGLGKLFNFITARGGSGKNDPLSFSGLNFVLLVLAIGFIPIILLSLFVGMDQQARVNWALTSSPTQQGSRYIAVTKTPSRTTLPNGSSESVTYTVTIQATTEALTSISVSDTFTAYTKTGASIKKPAVSWPTSLAAGETFSTSYAMPASGMGSDAAVVNTLTVTADAGEAKGEQTTVSSSVIIGSPAIGCFVPGPAGTPDAFGHISSAWTASDWAAVMGAVAQLSRAPAFLGLACKNGDPILTFRVNAVYGGGSVSGGKIFLYNGGVSSTTVLYTISHELGHIVAGRQPGLLQEFLAGGYIQQEGFLWTYPFDSVSRGSRQTTGGIPSEDFAETIGAYVVHRFYSFKTGRGDERSPLNYQTEYPKHYDFAKQNVFGGAEF